MSTNREEAALLLRKLENEQDELSLVNYLASAPKEVIKGAVERIRDEICSQRERDNNTLDFYDKSCHKIIEILGKGELSDSQRMELLTLLRELLSRREAEKQNQDKKTEVGIRKVVLIASLAAVVLVVPFIISKNKKK